MKFESKIDPLFEKFSTLRFQVLRKNGGIEYGLGSMNYELAGCLMAAWIIVYFIIYKGLHSSGKVHIQNII